MSNYEYEWQIVYKGYYNEVLYYGELSDVDWDYINKFGKYNLRLVRWYWENQERKEANVIGKRLQDRFDLDLEDLGASTPLVPKKFHNELRKYIGVINNG